MLDSQSDLRAIIIDPDPAYLAAIRRLLTRSLINWQCVYSSESVEATDMLQQGFNPHLIISDSLDGDIAHGEDLLSFAGINERREFCECIAGYNSGCAYGDW